MVLNIEKNFNNEPRLFSVNIMSLVIIFMYLEKSTIPSLLFKSSQTLPTLRVRDFLESNCKNICSFMLA
ncbi:hypothetical protein [Peptoniphilus rhinitidis]|uniref:hypothetical protein n=1 Tax=Peptoniphilus rhinitidis TaxID=1175452 RepID=UPI00130540B8|nr:hypothetical protein [Peptoniphilus rhinitidis]